jgi:hypothetical protein
MHLLYRLPCLAIAMASPKHCFSIAIAIKFFVCILARRHRDATHCRFLENTKTYKTLWQNFAFAFLVGNSNCAASSRSLDFGPYFAGSLLESEATTKHW